VKSIEGTGQWVKTKKRKMRRWEAEKLRKRELSL
jgi:hypothetical protein